VNRHIAFDRLHNFRDIGGYPTADGRTTRWHRLYRSDALCKLTGEDWTRYRALGVRTVIDLRYPWEIERTGRVPDHDGLAWHNLPIEHRPYDQSALAHDVEPARLLADKNAEVALDGVEELRRAIEIIATDGTTPVVVHCAAGKDRTGLLVALVLALVGVGEDDIVADYALTGRATDRFVSDWKRRRAHLPEMPPLWPGYGQAPAEAMRLFLTELAAEHGSVDAYARKRLGVDDALRGALQAQLVE
jgi:protein-tyrosine phosphatase